MTAFELMAKLLFNKDEYDRGMDEAESRAESAGSTIAHGLGVATAAVGAAIGAAAVGVGRLTVASVQAYGEYEQLAGGISKLFGDASNELMEYASNAYATAGMDANTYMQSVTSFSAALINSLDGDTERAAEIADMAMRDLSDNANTFGTATVEELSNIYSALARGSFQTLDSLNLGYAGTQEGMVQLINDSGIFEEKLEDLSNVSFDDMLLAIHEVQEQMNIAGTTENEAASTIQGSINMLTASWQNLVIGMADADADLGGLINNVVDSATIAVDNLLPAISQALSGIATLIERVAPMVSDMLPDLIDQILPPLLSAAIQITNALVRALPSILSTVSRAIPQLLNTLIPTVLQLIPQLISAGAQLLGGLMRGIIDNADLLLSAVTDVIFLMANEILTPENISNFVEMATQMILTISEAILENAPLILASVVMIISNVLIALSESLPDILDQITLFIINLGEQLGSDLWDIFGNSLLIVGQGMQNIWNKIVEKIDGVKTSISDAFVSITTWVTDGIDGWVSFFSDGFDNIYNTVSSILNDVLGVFSTIWDDAKSVVSGAIEFIQGLFDFEWSLPPIQLPHFSIQGGVAPYGLGGQGTFPSISVEWYKKAYDQPMILNDPTIFGFGGGKALGGGDGYGGELVMGYNQLLDAIREASNTTVVVPVYIGGEQIDEFVVNSNQRNDFISGGRG